MSVDLRTRRPGDAVPVVPAAFFEQELPGLIAEHRSLAIPGARELDPRPLAITVGDRSWTMALADDTIAVRAGTEGATAVVVLDAKGFSDLVADVLTPMGFFTGGTLDMPTGRLEDFLDWWVVLRSLIDGRPVHARGDVTFVDRSGAPLDLDRVFTPADDDAEMSHFLAEAGFLHVGGVFTADEMAAVDADIDRAAPTYAPDDGRSWWAKTADGENRLVRLQRFQQHSAMTAGLLDDERFLRLGRLPGDGHVVDASANTVEALIKPIGVVEGISDLPWHKDCSLGRHSYRCCSLTVGISVTGADAATGQLRVVAGSHRALIQPAFVRRGLDLPQVDLPTRTGDVTVHLSCTLHMSQAPVDAERRVLYTGFRLPSDDDQPVYDAKLSAIREGAYRTVSQPPSVAGRR